MEKMDGRPRSSVLDVQFSPNGKQLATTPETTLWDLESGQEIQTFPGGKWSVAFSPDGQRLAYCGTSGIQVWDLVSGKAVVSLRARTSSIYSLAFSPDSRRLASASADGTAKVWDAVSGKEIVTYRGHTTKVYRVAFSPNGETVASVGGDYGAVVQPGEVKIWNATSGKEVQTLRGHPAAATDVAYDPKADRLATVSKDGSIKIWDLSLCQDVRVRAGGGLGNVDSNLVFGVNGQLLITPQGGVVKVWDVATGQEKMSLEGFSRISKVALSPNQQLLAIADDGKVRVWDLPTRQEKLLVDGFETIKSFDFTPDGRELIAGNHQNLKVWDASTGEEEKASFWSKIRGVSLRFSPDGKRFAWVDARKVKVWDWPAKREFNSWDGPIEIAALTFSRDGKLLAAVGSDKLVRIWEVATGCELQSLQGHMGPVRGISFHPNNRRLATCSADTTVKLWDLETGVEIPGRLTLTIEQRCRGLTCCCITVTLRVFHNDRPSSSCLGECLCA